MRTSKAVIPWWLPIDAVTSETLPCFEHVSRAECKRRAIAGLIVMAEPTGRIWRTVPQSRTDDATRCRSTLISTALSKVFRETVVADILRRPLHEIEDEL